MGRLIIAYTRWSCVLLVVEEQCMDLPLPSPPSTLLVTVSPDLESRLRSIFSWRHGSVSRGRDCRSCCSAEHSWLPPRLPTSLKLTENLPGWSATMVASS